MKTLLFIVLKVLEIAGMIAAYFLTCTIGFFIIKLYEDTPNQKRVWNPHELYRLENLATGLIFYVGIFIALVLIFVIIPDWIALNKKWVNKILK